MTKQEKMAAQVKRCEKRVKSYWELGAELDVAHCQLEILEHDIEQKRLACTLEFKSYVMDRTREQVALQEKIEVIDAMLAE